MGADRNANATAELIGVLAHELRNPLASLQGCAMTLLDRADELPPELRRGLTSVIVGQSKRMEWLIGAVAALGGLTRRFSEGDVHVGSTVRAAAATAGAGVEGSDGTAFLGDERRVRLALEALFLALLGGGASGSARILDGGSALEVTTTAKDLTHGGRGWKLKLARQLLKEEGCTLRTRKSADHTVATVRFPGSATTTKRRIA